MRAWENGLKFKDVLLEDTELLEVLTKDEIESAFDINHSLRWVDETFNRVFNS